MDSEPALRRSKREHQPSVKAAASSAAASLPPTSSSASRRSQRRRVPLSASPASTPTSTRNSSPVRGPVASPASSELASVVVDAVGPNGQRRRVRAAAHTGSNSSGTPQGQLSSTVNGVHDDGKVLGRYSSHVCALLCEVILSQLKKQTLAPTVLDEAKSPAFIKWEPVAKKMETTHKLRMTPRECQTLWKFLAYGNIPVVDTDELLPDSDEEDFHKTPAEIKVRVTASREQAAQDKDTTDVKHEQAVTFDENREQENAGKPEQRESSLRLYPTYSLPTGAPDAWYRPFGPKDALPLTFVASRFLRRKPTPPLQTLISKATATGQMLLADLKRKQAVPIASTAAKKPKLTPPVSTPPRVFTPSSTPPPAAQRARTELEFFELRLREEHAKKTPDMEFEVSAADLKRRFEAAPVDARHQCQLLAAHDVERFNREVVRARIWQKALGSTAASSHTKSSGPTAALLAHTAAVTAAVAKAKR
ncbi:protein kinase [Phytophthora infestans T30-4]|uniref:Protein kinase n=2 Tax=Phytophthora infestans TaxID=4787 RepID=D0N2G0_PHYIT|nr:protein kinase [Phytophthora infestans T30-4]EEY68489.1 protein kinase [Phytophthora infestans T30-4]KAF4046063.1 hypothetical protein GN244_ATG01501 [Phytophthora infestans]KAF4140470.1 hypothetical protein GN958_ATG10330 [Phytophthora infestans]KAI9994785.1 hypothetical protein PInf_011616 [Phytophthora infestans]|eukprot:XP_002905648.1 protein kinase [Phytophthora infestans T30-4]